MNNSVQQMMALAAQQQAPANQQGVAVGACGPMANYGQAAVAGCGPQVPALPQGAIVTDQQYQECFVPLGINFGVDAAGNVYPASAIGAAAGSVPASPGFQLFPRNGNFFIFGVKFFETAGNVELDSVITGNSDWNHLLGSTDVAAWNSTDCFCPVQWGCISITNPLRITAHAIPRDRTDIVAVRGTAWGIRRASAGSSCGPCTPCGY